MRIVILTEQYSEKMGYIENALPKALARLGAEVHLVTSRLKPYYWRREFKRTYGSFHQNPDAEPESTQSEDGYQVHYLRNGLFLRRIRLVHLRQKLKSLRPAIVQCFETGSWPTIEAALARTMIGYKLFTGAHITASVFPMASEASSFLNRDRARNLLVRRLPGLLVGMFTEKCYGATQDCADIAVRFLGVPRRKMFVTSLGVDTDIFFPVESEESRASRDSLRKSLGFTSHNIVCIYTGRFSDDKNPLVLARAVARLAEQGLPFRALFVGAGIQAEGLKACLGCVVHPFVPFADLGRYMRAADVGVWPTQESTSMLDAAACGLPIVVNDTLVATERIAGNGLMYKLNDVEDMSRVLLALRASTCRRQLGEAGAKKMATEFSWSSLAKQRLVDYEQALNGCRSRWKAPTSHLVP